MNSRVVFSLLVNILLGFIFLNMPPVLDEMMVLYGVSYAGISILLSAMIWSHAVMQFPSGLIADRLGIRRTLVIGLTCLAVGNFMVAAAPVFGLAVIGRVITGIGTGLSFITALKLLSISAPPGRTGAFLSFFAGSFALGSIISYLTVPYIFGLGWRWLHLLPGIACPILIVVLLRLDLATLPGAAEARISVGPILRLRAAWTIGLMHSLCWGTVIGFGNWVPTLLADAWGSPAVSLFAWGGALMMLSSAVGRVSGGFIMLRLSSLLVGRGAILVMAFIFAGLFFSSSPVIVLCLALSAAWFSSVNFGALFNLAAQAAPPDSIGSVFGFVNFLANLGAILFTLLFGFLKDTLGTFEWGFAVLVIWAVVSLVVSRSLKEDPGPLSPALNNR